MILLRAFNNWREKADLGGVCAQSLDRSFLFASVVMSLKGSTKPQSCDRLRNDRYPSPFGRHGSSRSRPPIFSQNGLRIGQEIADLECVKNYCWNFPVVSALLLRSRARKSKEQNQCKHSQRFLPSWRFSAFRHVATRWVNRHLSAQPWVRVHLQPLMVTSRPAQLLVRAATSPIANPIRNAADLNTGPRLGPYTYGKPSKPAGLGGFFTFAQARGDLPAPRLERDGHV